MQGKNVELDERDLIGNPLTEKELDELIGDRDYKLFLNTRNELYRERNMAERPPTRAEAIKLMVQEPRLIRRPLVIRGKQIVFGFDEQSLGKLIRR
ncbi:MAG: hypothetical protein HY046_00895 [Acidobacteria bacterium]|nr:hypothetical protein [Acidobacteriota bacterium]